MKRYGKIVLKAGEGITFGVEERGSETLIIRARKIDTADDNSANSANLLIPTDDDKSANSAKLPIPTDDDKSANSAKLPIPIADGNSANYANPPIPEGYKYVCGEWNNGFVIERCSDGSQFVWIPVGSLEPNGTLDDGKTFSEQFGRRNYRHNRFSRAGYSSNRKFFTEKLASLKKYGGFYISRYNLSKLGKKWRSIKEATPYFLVSETALNPDYTSKIRYIDNELQHFEKVFRVIFSCLPGGEEYDSILEWFIESGSRTFDEIAEDSTGWGNFLNAEKTSGGVRKTGSEEKWCTNNIYDFAGNLAEVTAERFDVCSYTFRGGPSCEKGDERPVAHRDHGFMGSDFAVGFRVVLFIM